MQVTPRVHALRIPFRVPTGPDTGVDRFVYAFVLLGTRTALLDTGVSGSTEALLSLVTEQGRSPQSVSRIILTHGHVNHIGSAKALRELTQATIHAHPAERMWIEDINTQARERPVPGFSSLVGGSVPIDEPLQDGQLIELADDLHLRVIHTPGHSPGSTSFLMEEEGLLFTGDAIPIQGDMPVYDDPVSSVRSLARLRAIPNVRVLLSSWDEPRDPEPLSLCKTVLSKLDLPESMANPLVARTLLGHYRARGYSPKNVRASIRVC